LSRGVQLAFTSCSDDLVPTLIAKMAAIAPRAELFVVSEFPPPEGRWVRWHPRRTLGDNLALCRAAIAGRRVEIAGVVLQPRMPYWKMRALPLLIAPLRTLFFNENLDHFMLRPRSLRSIARHALWRLGNLARWELRPGGATYTLLWRIAHPRAFARPTLNLVARAAGVAGGWVKAAGTRAASPAAAPPAIEGVSVVVPSRDGRDLLARLLPGLLREMEALAGEVIAVDNGSTDGTAAFLAEHYPGVVVASSAGPLSFARAVNRGLARARFSRVCLLNNDMDVEPGFFAALLDAFAQVPDLFAATAQILFPEGARREETGKAVLPGDPSNDFPVYCETPLEGEDGTWVLYGSGGCTLYDAVKLRALGGLSEIYEPAYVEDLDVGWRAWQRGWPSIYAAGARVLHRHRATTSRFFSPAELDRVLEVNYLKFLAHSVASPELFRRLWRQAIARLNALAARMEPVDSARAALGEAAAIALSARPASSETDEALTLALTGGAVAVFPGGRPTGRPVVLVAAPYLPFPLSHGGAVRMYNLMRRAAADFDLVLISFVERAAAPPRELLDICREIVTVGRRGTHILPDRGLPDVVEEFASSPFRAALRQTVRKWRPGIVQLEFTQLAQYAADCVPARVILVEHDVTLDLYRQLLAAGDDWELRRQHERWEAFERDAWGRVDSIVVMSEKDRRIVGSPKAVAIPNGVDLERFTPSTDEPDPARLLFIGSFAHLPNVMAADFLLNRVWPLLPQPKPRVHVIAGMRHRYYLDSYSDRVSVNLDRPGVEVEGFVADPRPAYRRATLVVAPLVVSAGTNIKIMEAMAMGKAVVSTPAGINGLDLAADRDVALARSAGEMAEAIAALLADPARRRAMERQARATVEREFHWDAIAGRQKRLYDRLLAR
jgi:GT2 family glycosyltransferase/glycosyltransferase involved in cell wall biosynthesis